MSSGVVLEFCGLPGAGKSFLAAQLLDALRARGLPAVAGDVSIGPDVGTRRRLARKLRLCARQLTHTPYDVIRLGGMLLRSAQPGLPDVAARYVQATVTQQTIVHGKGLGAVTVLEEGAIQALWSIGLRGDVTPLLSGIRNDAVRWTLPDIVVAVDVPVDVAMARLHARESQHSRTQLLTLDAQGEELSRGQELLDRLLGWFGGESAGPGDLLRVDGSGSVAVGATVERIVDRLATAGR